MSDFDTPPPPATVKPSSQGLIARVQAILTKPAPTWDVIAAEPSSIQSIYMGYVIPLAAIPPIAGAIKSVIFGNGIPGLFAVHTSPVAAIIGAVVSYALSLVTLYILALIIDWLAPQFDGQKNMLAAFKVAAYSMTAAWVGGIFQLLPMIGGLLVFAAGLYGIYLFYLGLPRLMKSPPDKTIVYMIVAAVVGVIAFAIPAMIAGTITSMALFGTMGSSGLTASNGGSITINAPNGKATFDVDKMTQAANQMAAAVSAQTNAQQNGGTVKVADPQQLLALMPANYMGAARSNENASSGGAAGISAASAEATYTIGDGSITLKIADLGTAAGLGAFAAAMNVNTSSSSATGYDKITTSNGVMTEEEYDTADKSGKYSVVTNGRISIEAEGNGVDINALKNLVSSIDVGRAQALTQ